MERATTHPHSPLLVLHLDDLQGLLSTAPEALFGAILCLNRVPRYHNSLNAVVIAELVGTPAPGTTDLLPILRRGPLHLAGCPIRPPTA